MATPSHTLYYNNNHTIHYTIQYIKLILNQLMKINKLIKIKDP